MASLTQESSGSWRIEFRRDGKRHFLRIGPMPRKAAEHIRGRVESLHSHAVTGIAYTPELSAWVAEVGDDLANRLHRAGLLPKRDTRESFTVRQWIERYIDGKPDAAANSVKNYKQAAKKLYAHFGPDRTIQSVTSDGAEQWAAAMRKAHAPAFAARLVKFARQFFKKAPLPRNPFADIKPGSMANASRLRFVTRAEIDRVLDACPDGRWRLIVGLARYGGLRCPSEIRTLVWGDFDWGRGRFLVRSPKTKQDRWVPLFPELRPHVDAEWAVAPEGAVRVVTFDNLRTHFVRIVERAGLTPWTRLFQNLRASRETELMNEYPLHVVTAWIGHTAAVAAKHYLSVTEDHFAAAGGKSGGTLAGNPALPGTAVHCRGLPSEIVSSVNPSRISEKARENERSDSEPEYTPQEADQVPFSLVKRGVSVMPGGISGGIADDSDLATVIAAWPALPRSVREQIVRLAGVQAK